MDQLQLVVFVRGNYYSTIVPASEQANIIGELNKARSEKLEWTFSNGPGHHVTLDGGSVNGFYFIPYRPSVQDKLLEEVKKLNSSGEEWRE